MLLLYVFSMLTDVCMVVRTRGEETASAACGKRKS